MKIPLSFRLMRATLKPLSFLFPGLMSSFWMSYFMETSRHERPGWERELLKTGEPMTLAGGLRVWSFGGPGPLVVLAHGWDGRGSQMGRFIAPLTAAGFRVVIFDGPAHGDSPGKWTNLVFQARAMLALTDELVARYGPLRGVVAHSFGAAASTLAARLGMDARKLVLIASPCSMQNVIDRYVHFVEMSPRCAREMQRKLEGVTGYRPEQLAVDRIVEGLPHVEARIFHDPDDAEVPFAEAECIARSWPRAKLVSMPGAGHRRILKNAAVIEQTIQFLS